ncbi:uncharacterized protein YgbK (DUF1537 family) [Mycetocola sp. CAN_C7]|uniref:four-carbon acid sugar kinase family protein n=1 Tax=Mycetocola sp. CAN_C7 TaxID=2787724 RepID=UPI0018CA469D
MSDSTEPLPTRSADQLRAAVPDAREIAGARARIRDANASARRWVIVLDDDPTGSQSVHDTPVLTRWQRDDLLWAFDQPGNGFFILTNTRGLNDDEARARMTDVSEQIRSAALERGANYTLIARGDSTLRGHYPLETDLLIDEARSAGTPYDALLLAPAYLAAGRITVDDVHYVGSGDTFTPVGQSSYARDATFGFTSSNLRDYVEEKTAGTRHAGDVTSIGLDDIRSGGIHRVRDIILGCTDAAPVVVNALDDSDLDVVVLGILAAEEAGARILTRSGPSFAAARLGVSGRAPLTHDEIFSARNRPGNGLIVVGSHVELTTRQVARLRSDLPDIETVELDVPKLLDQATSAEELDRCGTALVAALGRSDALLASSREQIVGETGHSSLVIAQTVSSALISLTSRAVQETPPAWVLAKGGITSSDVATDGLRIRRATVAGQLFPGIVSLWLNEGEDSQELDGLPYVVFAGNVGDDATLAAAVRILRGDSNG